MSNEITANRSALKEFLASIATISGDLSNITAPPFVLSTNSTVEIPQYWADHQTLFVSQSKEEDPEKRALGVLRYFLCTLRNQQYAGRREEDGVKKPLNAFLGEIFLGDWNDEELGETRLVSEQVSHHPPVTACYLWNDKHGVRAQGFTQQEITFSGNVSIKQKGYAVLHIDQYDEDYLIPVPTVKVKGILTGVPYPELTGEYSIISSSGYVSHIKFNGRTWYGGGQKNAFKAKLFHADSPEDILYTAEGAWNGKFTITDMRQDTQVEEIDVNSLPTRTINVAPVPDQDAWESRNAWKEVIEALHKGDMRAVVNAKSKVEEGQRQMRKDEVARNEKWNGLFFKQVEHDPIFENLSVHDPNSFTIDSRGGIWKVDREAAENMKKPFHGELTPANVPQTTATEDANVKVSAAEPESDGESLHSEETLVASGSASDDEELRKDGGIDLEYGRQDELKKAKGISASESDGPTDIQVAEFLRARHSNLSR